MMRLSTVAISSGTSKVPGLVEIEIIRDWSVTAEELMAKVLEGGGESKGRNLSPPLTS